MNFPNPKSLLFAGALVLTVCGLAAGLLWLTKYSGDPDNSLGSTPQELQAEEVPEVPEPTLIPIDEEEALKLNDRLPFSSLPIEPARPLVLDADSAPAGSFLNATNCLAAAIYYEGATEPMQGRRAIAQVVINRARHPAFPNSICGVVYQGSERRTGCQFTFTCDGSLRRRPSRSGWDQARAIAQSALNGQTEPGVGMATHYHADYVVPYWAKSLEKISKIGVHIFYRWRGNWGRPFAFSQNVIAEPEPSVGNETSALIAPLDIEVPSSAINSSPVEQLDFAQSALRSDRDSGRLIVDLAPEAMKQAPSATAPELPRLEADRSAGRLRVDEIEGNQLRD